MTLFRFSHAQKNAFALFIPFAFGQIAINLRRLDFCAPISLDHFDRLLSIFSVIRWIFVFHRAQSAGATAALNGGSTRALSCCAVITIATEPMIRPAATKVRMLKVSPAKAAPSNTATIGFTYGSVATFAGPQWPHSQI